VRSLGQIGPAAKSALPEIEKLLNDPESIVRDAAKIAIRRIDPAKSK
jgi:HEAT repeat protein